MKGYHTNKIAGIYFENITKLLYTSSYDKTIKIWNTDNGKCIRTLKGHTFSVWDIYYDNYYNILFSGSNDHTIKIWNLMIG